MKNDDIEYHWSERPNHHGFVVTQEPERLMLAHRKPNRLEGAALDDYCERYAKAMGFPPHGLHFLTGMIVWFPPLLTSQTVPLGRAAARRAK